MMLDKESILAAEDLRTEEVQVPEWGGSVYVRTLTGKERDAWEATLLDGTGRNRRVKLDNIRASLAAATICDAQGKQLFGPEDVAALGEKSALALDRVFEVAQRLNGLTGEDVEELVGNSGGDRKESSGSS